LQSPESQEIAVILILFYLDDKEYFLRKKGELKKSRDEDLWQLLFDENRWIFGFGLSAQLLLGWDEQKLERVVAGASVAGAGKRADALMRTAGLISSLCFVEIKLPTTPLLVQQRHRPEVWHASAELSSGVAQSHVTVEKARRAIGTKLLVEILTGSKQASAHLHPDHVPTFWLAAWISS
jgi:Domain of unknown function (DUF4263)